MREPDSADPATAPDSSSDQAPLTEKGALEAAVGEYVRALLEALGLWDIRYDWPDVSPLEVARARRFLRDLHRDLVRHAKEASREVRWYHGRRFLWRGRMLHYLEIGLEVSLALLEFDHRGLCPGAHAPQEDDPDPALFEGRPSPLTDHDQLYCTTDSTVARVRYLLRNLPSEDARVLFLGDDDLGGVALHALADLEVHALDIDPELLGFISSRDPEIRTHEVNLHLGIPANLADRFDLVVMDPHWELGGASQFLNAAWFCLRKERTSRILLSLYPPWTYRALPPFRDGYPALIRRIQRLGMGCEEIICNFNAYPLDQYPDEGLEYRRAFDWLAERGVDPPLAGALRALPCWLSHLHHLAVRRLPGRRSLRHWMFRAWHRTAPTDEELGRDDPGAGPDD